MAFKLQRPVAHPYYCPRCGWPLHEKGLGVLGCSKCEAELIPTRNQEGYYELMWGEEDMDPRVKPVKHVAPGEMPVSRYWSELMPAEPGIYALAAEESGREVDLIPVFTSRSATTTGLTCILDGLRMDVAMCHGGLTNPQWLGPLKWEHFDCRINGFFPGDEALYHRALSMYANWIETKDPLLSANDVRDGHILNRKPRQLDPEQIPLVARLRQLASIFIPF